MPNEIILCSGKYQLRYSFTFEASLMAILIPTAAVFFDKSLLDMGLLGLVLSRKVLLVSLLFNWIFDHLDAGRGRVSSARTAVGTILHALGFELTLLLTSLPFYIWLLDLTLFEALATDLIVTNFVVAYTYFSRWATIAYSRCIRQTAWRMDKSLPPRP